MGTNLLFGLTLIRKVLLMRYPENMPPEQLAHNTGDGMLLFTAVLAIFIGVALTLLGKQGKHLWMFVWGIGLIACSFALILYIVFW